MTLTTAKEWNYGPPSIEWGGYTWIRKAGEGGWLYHQMWSGEPDEFLMAVSTGGSIFHHPYVDHLDEVRIAQTSRQTRTSQRGPVLLRAGFASRVVPYCALEWWSPFWSLVKFGRAKLLAPLHRDGVRLCVKCWFPPQVKVSFSATLDEQDAVRMTSEEPTHP